MENPGSPSEQTIAPEIDERQPLVCCPDANNGDKIYGIGRLGDEVRLFIDFQPGGDPENPLDWPHKYKWGIVVLLAVMAFTVTFTCIGIVPIASSIVRDLEGHKDKSSSVLFVTIWELGEAAGPLLIAPLSEIFGRYLVYNIANVLFIGGTVLSALSPDAGVLIFARFLTGCAVASNVLNPSIIGDMFPSECRGSGMSAVMLAPLIGGATGPIIGSAIAERFGWRKVMWMAVILATAAEISFLTLLRETYKVRILRRRAARLRAQTGDQSLKTEFDTDDERTVWPVLRSVIRPVILLCGSFVLQIISLWGALVFTLFYIMSTTLPDMLQDIYGFSNVLTGLSFQSFSIGSILGIAISNIFVDKIYVKLQRRQGATIYPEGRLPLVILGAFILPLVVAFYGWSAELRWPVWLLLLAVILLGFVVVFSLVPMMTFVTDTFGVHSASALTAVLVTRCLTGTFLPLATASLTDKIGYGLGFTVLAGACLMLAPIPLLVFRYGPRWRQLSKDTMVD